MLCNSIFSYNIRSHLFSDMSIPCTLITACSPATLQCALADTAVLTAAVLGCGKHAQQVRQAVNGHTGSNPCQVYCVSASHAFTLAATCRSWMTQGLCVCQTVSASDWTAASCACCLKWVTWPKHLQQLSLAVAWCMLLLRV